MISTATPEMLSSAIPRSRDIFPISVTSVALLVVLRIGLATQRLSSTTFSTNLIGMTVSIQTTVVRKVSMERYSTTMLRMMAFVFRMSAPMVKVAFQETFGSMLNTDGMMTRNF